MKCPNCISDLPTNAKYCPICGSKIEIQGKTCPNPECSRTGLPPEALFCPDCGSDLNDNPATNVFSDNPFFPIYGITLGKTTKSDVIELGYTPELYESGPTWYVDVADLTFWDHDEDGILKEVHATSGNLPRKWKELGMDLSNSYNVWMNLFSKYDFEVFVLKNPETEHYSSGKVTLSAEIKAVNEKYKLSIRLVFNYGNSNGEGYSLDSINTLHSITLDVSELYDFIPDRGSKLEITRQNVISNKDSIEGNSGTFVDERDGYEYKWIRIGDKIWMAENLAYRAASGCWAYDNDKSNVKEYGYLYNWETALKVCPNGWHLPSEEEWMNLQFEIHIKTKQFIKDDPLSKGKAMASKNGWKESNVYGTIGNNPAENNETGFNAKPGGVYSPYKDSFLGLHSNGSWWTSSKNQENKEEAHIYVLFCDNSHVSHFDADKNIGISVRCIKN